MMRVIHFQKYLMSFFMLSLFAIAGCEGCHKVDPIEALPKKNMDMKEFEESESVPATLWKVIE
jgi:hypothetical protein